MAQDIDLGAGVAKCRACNEVIRLGDHREPGNEPVVDVPAKVHVDASGGGLTFTWSWRDNGLILLIPFAVALNGFLVMWYVMAAQAGPEEARGPENWVWLLMVAFPLLHVVVGLGVGYVCLAKLSNHTRLTLLPNVLSVRHGPLPWKMPNPIAPRNIDAVFIMVDEACEPPSGAGGPPEYALYVRLQGGHRVKLLGRVGALERARFFLQQIERFYRLTPRSVEDGLR